jgi:hypothetical protein
LLFVQPHHTLPAWAWKLQGGSFSGLDIYKNRIIDCSIYTIRHENETVNPAG